MEERDLLQGRRGRPVPERAEWHSLQELELRRHLRLAPNPASPPNLWRRSVCKSSSCLAPF